MIQSFTIPGRLLGRNDREALARAHWSSSANAKKDETELVAQEAWAAGIKPMECPCEVAVIFREKVEFYKNGTRKSMRDVDNVIDGHKPILDGLVLAGIIPDDDPVNVRRVIPSVEYADEDPHITVTLLPYEPDRVVRYKPVSIPGEEE